MWVEVGPDRYDSLDLGKVIGTIQRTCNEDSTDDYNAIVWASDEVACFDTLKEAQAWVERGQK